MKVTMNNMMKVFRILQQMPCFFKEVTGFYCPACGGTRAVKALLHLDIWQAFCSNPTVVYGAVMILWCLIWNILRIVSGKTIRFMKPGLWMLVAGVVLFFGYAVIRNILVWQFGYDYLGDLL